MSNLFQTMGVKDFEQVVFNYDRETGLKAIIAIHDTTLGPALGGTRLWNYDTEEEALHDVLRLARGMTYKNAAAGLNLGGGKAVIIGDVGKIKSEALWRTYGRFVQSLNGRYITAEDVNTNVSDMAYVAQETNYVTGLKEKGGDPSPVTAYGVWKGMKAAVEEVYGTTELKGKVIAIQGVGHVGYYLARHIAQEGGKLIVCDINQKNIDRVVNEFSVEVVDPDQIYSVDCDIFAPCALGGVINDCTIPELKCDIVAGSANNVMAEERHGLILEDKGILYAPDYVINAGGVINCYHELIGYDRDRAYQQAEMIYDNLKKVFAISKRDKIPTSKAADIMAEERMEKIGNIHRNFIPGSRIGAC